MPSIKQIKKNLLYCYLWLMTDMHCKHIKLIVHW